VECFSGSRRHPHTVRISVLRPPAAQGLESSKSALPSAPLPHHSDPSRPVTGPEPDPTSLYLLPTPKGQPGPLNTRPQTDTPLQLCSSPGFDV
jgi:hypothetical protein